MKAKSDLSISETIFGFKLRFMSGSVLGYGNTNGKFFATYQKNL